MTQVFHGEDMSLCQIVYVNIVPDAGSVFCVIVISKDGYIVSLIIGNL